jgi:hypothetical protein
MAADIAPNPGGGARGRAAPDGDTLMGDAGDGVTPGDAGHLIGSAGYDRTVKLWAPQETLDLFAGGDELPF